MIAHNQDDFHHKERHDKFGEEGEGVSVTSRERDDIEYWQIGEACA
jgi:hypothetical protein